MIDLVEDVMILLKLMILKLNLVEVNDLVEDVESLI